jgi:hypothetical protein
MARDGKQVVEEQSDDDIFISQRKRKVGSGSQCPCGHGRTNAPAAPRRSTEQDHRARTKHVYPPNAHYDDISLDTLAYFS